MIRKLGAPFFITILDLLTICAPILAHHGTAGVFDNTHRITTRATVTDYLWANPHVQIRFTLKNDKGVLGPGAWKQEVRETCSGMAGRRRHSSRETNSW